MGRPKQDGLLYFSFDTDFFYADKRIKRLHSRYGSDGMIFFIYLLTEIYRNGYYAGWDAESVENAVDDLRLTEGFIEQVMAFLVSRSLIVKITPANPDTALPIQKAGDDRPQCESAGGGDGQKRAEVITSPGIQKRYQEAIKSRKRDVYVDAEIWLLNEEETAPCIKVTHNVSKSCGNDNKSGRNESKSCGNGVKESKGKESKGNKRENAREVGGVSHFEDFLSAYPKGCNRYLTEHEYALLLETGKITEDDLVQCAKNYAEACRIQETPERYIKNAENFLKEFVFEKYLPGAYRRPEGRKKAKNAFCNFNQRETDYDRMVLEEMKRMREQHGKQGGDDGGKEGIIHGGVGRPV